MSATEKSFLKWFGSLATILLAAAIIGVIGMYYQSGVVQTLVENNKTEIQQNTDRITEVKETHKADFESLKADQRIIMQDVKEILKEIK